MVQVLKSGASKKDIEKINRKLRRMTSAKKLDAKKYCGVIKLKEDPVDIQMKLRNEF